MSTSQLSGEGGISKMENMEDLLKAEHTSSFEYTVLWSLF